MVTHCATSVSVTQRGSETPDSDPGRTVVWIRGDHDLGTGAELSATMASAERLDDADVVVDLSGVTFMDASTVSVLVGAHNRLSALGRSMHLRAPTPPARRLLVVCDLGFLVEEEAPRTGPAPALASWVAVPSTDVVGGPVARPVPSEGPGRTPAESSEPVASAPHARSLP